MSCFDPGPHKGPPFYLRPTTPEEHAAWQRQVIEHELAYRLWLERHRPRGTEVAADPVVPQLPR